MVNKFLSAGDKFMPEIHLRYSACGPFTKNREKIQKKQEIHDTFIKRNQVNLVFNMTWLIETLKI